MSKQNSKQIQDLSRRAYSVPTVLILTALLFAAVSCSSVNDEQISHISAQRADGKWVLVDNQGNELKDAQYTVPPTAMYNGLYLLSAGEGEPVEVYNHNAKKLDTEVVAAGRLSENRLPAVTPGGGIQILNGSGDVKFELDQIGGSPVVASAAMYRDGLLLVSTANGKAYLIDEDGEIVKDRKQTINNILPGKPVRSGELWGIADASGKQIVQPQYISVQASPIGWLCTLPDGKGSEIVSADNADKVTQKPEYQQIYYIQDFGYAGLKNGWIDLLDMDLKPASKTRYRRISTARQVGRLQSRAVDANAIAKSTLSTLQGPLFADIRNQLGRNVADIPPVVDKGTKAYSVKQYTVLRKAPEANEYSLSAALYFTRPIVKEETTSLIGSDEEEDSTQNKKTIIFNPNSRMYAYGVRLDFKEDNAQTVAHSLTEAIKSSINGKTTELGRYILIEGDNANYLIEQLSRHSLRVTVIDNTERKRIQNSKTNGETNLGIYPRYHRPIRR